MSIRIEGLCRNGPLDGEWHAGEVASASCMSGAYRWRLDWRCWDWEPIEDGLNGSAKEVPTGALALA